VFTCCYARNDFGHDWEVGHCDVDAFEGEGLAWEWNGLGNGLFEGPGGQRGGVGRTGLY